MKTNLKNKPSNLLFIIFLLVSFGGCSNRELIEVKKGVQQFIKLESEREHEQAYLLYSKRWKDEMRQNYHEHFYDDTSPHVTDGRGYAKYISSTEITWSGGKILSVKKEMDGSFDVIVYISSQVEGTEAPFTTRMKWIREGGEWKLDELKSLD